MHLFLLTESSYFSNTYTWWFLQMVYFSLLESGQVSLSCTIFVLISRKIWNYCTNIPKITVFQKIYTIFYGYQNHLYFWLLSVKCINFLYQWNNTSIIWNPSMKHFSMNYFYSPANMLSTQYFSSIRTIYKIFFLIMFFWCYYGILYILF